MFNTFAKLLLVLTAAVNFVACTNGNQPVANNQTRTNSANTTSTNTVNGNVANNKPATNSATNTVNTNTAANSNTSATTNTNSISVGNVTRISFAKGATSGTTNVVLSPNSAKQFAVEANYGQKIKVSTGSKDAVVKLISGTDRQIESAGGGLILEVQTSGDVIFEVRNSTAQEIKTTVRAEVTGAR